MKLVYLSLFIFLINCSKDRIHNETLFTEITDKSGIDFRNDLSYTEKLNPYTYRNFYNGAGVGIGDINNDGLLDIYLTGNQVDNKLYLNNGNLIFQDITTNAGVACSGVWSTGVTFVDINADGFLDIYVCKSGNPDAPHRNNELFINNGNLTFSEKSKEYGLDVIGLSVQAAFFDYDKDGDLDCYLLTNSIKPIGNFDLVKDQRNIPDVQGGGNKFFINDNGKFRDYSIESKIYRSSIGFGLGITLGDFNNDTWTDIFVSNDFFERDYLYINDQHGAFKESLEDYFQSISMGSMGADFADLDQDGSSELFVTEMLPDSLNRKKSKTIFENWNKYQLNLKNGYYHQFSRNVLQKKIGEDFYVDVGRLAGVAASEWSWGALIFDMDNDGKNDIFIANGIYKDLLDRDYLTYTGAEDNVRKIIREEKNAIIKLIDLMPSSTFQNYAYRNTGNFNFNNMSTTWGLGAPMYSSGSAYGDLDNDGDLDLVVNNINAPAVLYRNNTDPSKYKSLTVSLSTKTNNTFGIGAHVTAMVNGKIYSADNFVVRGYQSSVQPRVTFGLGENIQSIDSLLIQWPDNGFSNLYNIPVNSSLLILKEGSDIFKENPWLAKSSKLPFELQLVNQSIFKHKGCGLADFNRDRLLPMMYSNETPTIIKGDIDGDGKLEFYVGGGKDQSGAFISFIGNTQQVFNSKAIEKYSISEETRGTFLDIDNDGDLDFYKSNGGRFFPKSSSALIDNLFLNDGKGVFSEAINRLPINFISTSTASSIDFDNDGDNDLLVGERFDPFIYGVGGRGFLFENDGKGFFKDVTVEYAPALLNLGMITDIEVQDIDKDGWKDVVIVGDWMPITFLKNNHKGFLNSSEEFKLGKTNGWWHDVEAGDFNKDGKIDFVIGNHGLNSFFKPDDRMYVGDFDSSGSVEQIFCTNVNGKYYPIVDKDDFLSQLPSLRKGLLYYGVYAKKSIDELLSKNILDNAKIFQANTLASVLVISNKTDYKIIQLPLEAQFSPIYSFLVQDFDHDGILDLIAGGNQYLVKPQFGRFDASSGWFFKGFLKNGDFNFENGISLNVKGQIRDIESIEVKGIKYILFAKHNDEAELYRIKN